MLLNRVGWAGAVVLSNNTPRFRTCRKLLLKGLGHSAVHSFSAFLQRQAPFQLEELLNQPNNYDTIFRRYVTPFREREKNLPSLTSCSNAARISMKIAYGYNGVDEDEGLYAIAAEATRFFDDTAMLGAWLADSFPLCKSPDSE